jgi:hypothetical protein
MVLNVGKVVQIPLPRLFDYLEKPSPLMGEGLGEGGKTSSKAKR